MSMKICLIQPVDKECEVGTVQRLQERYVILLRAVIFIARYAKCWCNERCNSEKVCVLGFGAV